MVVSKKDNGSRILIINCNCGCDEEIRIRRFEDSDNEYYLTLHTSKFSSEQKGLIRRLLHRIKLSLKMLLGKEYLLTEIVLTKKEINEVITELIDIKKN